MIAVALLMAVLGFAVVKPGRLPEVLVAGAAALLAIVVGLVLSR